MKRDFYKGFKAFKIVQLVILFIFAIVFFLIMYVNDDLRMYVFTNKNILTICVFLWAFMIYSAVCVMLDFYQLEGHIIRLNSINKSDSKRDITDSSEVDSIFEE